VSAHAQAWLPRLVELSDRVREAVRGALLRAVEHGSLDELARPAGEGAGDVTYGIDVPAERALDGWLEERAREGPLSLLTEDTGWRHRGPDGRGGTSRLEGFGHGGPRIAVDPIDGTRVLMADLRPAWSVIAFAGPGDRQPQLSETEAGVLAEIPDSRAAAFRRLAAVRGGGCGLEERRLDDGTLLRRRRLEADRDDRAERGFFPFFRYLPGQRPGIARVEAAFFDRLERQEHAEVRTCFDDQYLSNGAQLALLALGTYRMIADLRAYLAARSGRPTLASKPYDVAGAILVAREAGCVVEQADGTALDFPIDVTTPVSFVGWANAATARRLRPHLSGALA